MLGAINQKQHNYIQSNIFLDIAIKQWYIDKESIYRLKLYNYLLLDQKEKINSTFDKIINLQKKPYFNDLVLASYYNIIDNKFKKALLFIQKWIKLYPKKEDFYWLKAWILIEENKLNEAEKLLKKAQEINPRNAVIALNMWRIELEKYKQTQKTIKKIRAQIFFKKALELDNTEIWSLAQKFLEEIKNIEK
jgi:tetratricopeptide (TPR) repeat protein